MLINITAMDVDMSALILAGGENRRIPFTKGLLELNGKPIVETLRDKLGKFFMKVMISTQRPELYFYLGLQMIGDTLPSRGPMAGIASALKLPGINHIFVVACDMPFVNDMLIEHMRAQWSGEWDASVPLFRGAPQPLLGIYSSRIARKMEKTLIKGSAGMRDFLKQIKVLYIDEEVVREIDPGGKSFVNINTFEDFKRERGGTTCLV